MRECKIGVGGCGGKIYKSFLAYSDELVGQVLKNMSDMGAEKELVNRGEEQWKPLFNGLWLDLDRDEVAGLKRVEERDENAEYNSVYYYLYNNPDVLTEELSHKMANLIGYRLDAPGFMHRPELQMIAFANPEISKAICSKIYASFQAIEFESLFFFVGLGGGTGTGVIGNLAGYIKNDLNSMQASFVLGLLTGKEDAHKGIRTQATFFRRSFNAIWALSDLVGGKKVACVMLMDNDKLSELGDVKEGVRKLKKGESEKDVVNRHVVRSIFPLLGKDELEQIDESRLREELAVADFTPIYVPCYWHGKAKLEDLEDLIVKAISEGKLADCDHTTADGAWVFTKGFMEDKDTVENAVKKGLETAGVTAKGLKVWRTKKVGGAHKDREVLILLKNPGIKELLSERIDLALDFICLIEIVEKVETGTEETSSLDILAASLKESIGDDTEGKQLLARIKAKFDEFVDQSKIERALIRVIAEAWVFSHSEKEFKFTEEVIESRGRFIEEFKLSLEDVKNRLENGESVLFWEHVKLKPGYLFSMGAQLKEDMNNGVISVELKKVFDTNGFPLLDHYSLTTEISNNEWIISDEKGKGAYIIEKGDKELNCYKSMGGRVPRYTVQEDIKSIKARLDEFEEFKTNLFKESITNNFSFVKKT
jgi:cell division GTPase FtsZ